MELKRDCIALASLLSIGVGCWWIYPPSALIVVGSVLLAGIVAGSCRIDRSGIDDTE